MPGSNAKIIAILYHNYHLWHRFVTIHARIKIATIIILSCVFLVTYLLKKQNQKIVPKSESKEIQNTRLIFFGSCISLLLMIFFFTFAQGVTTMETNQPQVIGASTKRTLCGQEFNTSAITLHGFARNNLLIVIKNVPKIRRQVKELHHTKKMLYIARFKQSQSIHHNNLKQWLIYKNRSKQLTNRYHHLHPKVKSNLLSLHEFMTGKPSHIII